MHVAVEEAHVRGWSCVVFPPLPPLSTMAELDAAAVPVLRERILEVLKEADLSTVSAKKIRLALADLPEGSLPAGLDLTAQKKAVDVVIRQCYDEYTSKKPAPKEKKAPKSAAKEKEPKKATKSKKRASTTEADGEPKKKRAPNPNSPINRPLRLSAEMSEVCGGNEMPRYAVVKQLWVYIKEHNLQNGTNKRQVRPYALT